MLDHDPFRVGDRRQIHLFVPFDQQAGIPVQLFGQAVRAGKPVSQQVFFEKGLVDHRGLLLNGSIRTISY